MPQLITQAADDEQEEMSQEEIEQAVRVAWEALQRVPAYVERPQPESD